MVTIDEQTLAAHGITLPAEGADEYMEELQSMVEERVGLAIVSHLGDDQAKQLLKLTESGDAAGVTAWLDKFMPDYNDVVQKEVDTVLDEMAKDLAEDQ